MLKHGDRQSFRKVNRGGVQQLARHILALPQTKEWLCFATKHEKVSPTRVFCFLFFFLALLPNPQQNWVNMRVRLQWNLNWHQEEVCPWGGECRRHLRHSLVREKKRSVVSLNQSQNLFYRRVNHCVVWFTRLQTHQPLALKLWARCVNSAWTALQNHIHHVFCCG